MTYRVSSVYRRMYWMVSLTLLGLLVLHELLSSSEPTQPANIALIGILLIWYVVIALRGWRSATLFAYDDRIKLRGLLRTVYVPWDRIDHFATATRQVPLVGIPVRCSEASWSCICAMAGLAGSLSSAAGLAATAARPGWIPAWSGSTSSWRCTRMATVLLKLGNEALGGPAAPGLLEQFLDAGGGCGGQVDAQPADPLAPAQEREGPGVFRHAGMHLRLIDKGVQVALVRRHRREDLAADPERRHVEVRFLAGPRQRQRELPGTFQIAHPGETSRTRPDQPGKRARIRLCALSTG
jgi:hypothetical protein